MPAAAGRLVLMALYPQYSASPPPPPTTRPSARWPAALAAGGADGAALLDRPVLHPPLADSVRAHLAMLDWEPELLVMSYHGLPKRYLSRATPTTATARRPRGWCARSWAGPGRALAHFFQSRFGREEWLQPYLDVTLEELPKRGTKRIAVMSPAFAADCLETLEEIDVQTASASSPRRRTLRLHPLPQRQRRPHRPARGAGDGRAVGVGVTPGHLPLIANRSSLAPRLVWRNRGRSRAPAGRGPCPAGAGVKRPHRSRAVSRHRGRARSRPPFP